MSDGTDDVNRSFIISDVFGIQDMMPNLIQGQADSLEKLDLL